MEEREPNAANESGVPVDPHAARPSRVRRGVVLLVAGLVVPAAVTRLDSRKSGLEVATRPPTTEHTSLPPAVPDPMDPSDPGTSTTSTLQALTPQSTAKRVRPPQPATVVSAPSTTVTASTPTTTPSTAACPFPIGPYAVDTDGAGNGWMVGSALQGGAVAVTADAGRTWTGVCIKPGILVDVTSFDHTRVWAVGSSAVWYSVDAGRTWDHVAVPIHGHLEGIAFADADHGWAVGSGWATDSTGAAVGPGLIVATSDGGRTWTPQRVPEGVGGLNKVAFADPLHGWAVGANIGGSRRPVVLATSDGGATWITRPPPPGSGSGLLDVAVVAPNRVVVVGQGSISPPETQAMGVAAASDDGGASWSAVSEMPGVFFWSLAARGQHLMAAGQGIDGTWGGNTYHSDDGGTTWTKAGRTGHGPLLGAALFGENDGWAVGFQEACLYVTHDGGTSWHGQPLREASSCSG